MQTQRTGLWVRMHTRLPPLPATTGHTITTRTIGKSSSAVAAYSSRSRSITSSISTWSLVSSTCSAWWAHQGMHRFRPIYSWRGGVRPSTERPTHTIPRAAWRVTRSPGGPEAAAAHIQNQEMGGGAVGRRRAGDGHQHPRWGRYAASLLCGAWGACGSQDPR